MPDRAHRPAAPSLVDDAPVAALVVAAQAGDRAAFAALYGRFHRAVHATALARVTWRDAGDVVQDVFAIALDRLAGLREPAAFPGWILMIARNRATDYCRRDPVADPTDEIGVAPVPRAEALEALAAIRALPEAYRETLIMRLVEGMTGPEIAERAGLTAESVRVNLHRGMKLLRESLGASEAPP